MKDKVIAVILVSFFVLAWSAYAKEQQPLSAQDVVAKMTTELNLTDGQIKAVTPIVEEATRKRQAFLESVEGEFITDKENVKMKMRRFQKEENEKLSKVLSEEQMRKLKGKQRLRAGLNKDEIDYSEGVGGGGFSADAASLQF